MVARACFVGCLGLLISGCGPSELAPQGGAGGSQISGGGGGSESVGGGSCGSTVTPSSDPRFEELVAFTQSWAAELGMKGGALGVQLEGEEPLIATWGVREAGTCDPVTEHTLFHSMNASKDLVTLTALLSVERGVLDPDALASSYVDFEVPEGPYGSGSEITARQLINKTHGLEIGWLPEVCADDGALASFFSVPFREPLWGRPGHHYYYSDQASLLLGQVLAEAHGVPYAEVVRELVFEPLGLGGELDPEVIAASERADGHASNQELCERAQPTEGLHTDIRDMLRLQAALASHEGVSEATWQDVLASAPQKTVETPVGIQSGLFVDGSPVFFYPEHWKGIAHWTLAAPEQGFVITFFGLVEDMIHSTAPCELALELFTDLELEVFDDSLDDLSEYEGVYEDAVAQITWEISAEGDKLVAKWLETGTHRILRPSTYWTVMRDTSMAASKSRDFFTLDLPGTDFIAQMRFWRDEAGEVYALTSIATGELGAASYRIGPL